LSRQITAVVLVRYRSRTCRSAVLPSFGRGRWDEPATNRFGWGIL